MQEKQKAKENVNLNLFIFIMEKLRKKLAAEICGLESYKSLNFIAHDSFLRLHLVILKPRAYFF